jgi:hypothetical protein
MSIEYGDLELEDFILDEIDSIREYSSRPDFNPRTLEIMNRKIERLTEINNGIYRFRFPDAWAFAEYQMKRMEEMNGRINGHLIDFNVDYRTGNFSKIIIPEELL